MKFSKTTIILVIFGLLTLISMAASFSIGWNKSKKPCHHIHDRAKHCVKNLKSVCPNLKTDVARCSPRILLPGEVSIYKPGQICGQYFHCLTSIPCINPSENKSFANCIRKKFNSYLDDLHQT